MMLWILLPTIDFNVQGSSACSQVIDVCYACYENLYLVAKVCLATFMVGTVTFFLLIERSIYTI